MSCHLDDIIILNKNQHGFKPGLPCETQHVEFLQEIHQGTIKGQVVSIIVDFDSSPPGKMAAIW